MAPDDPPAALARVVCGLTRKAQEIEKAREVECRVTHAPIRSIAAAFLLAIVTACTQGAPSAEGRKPKPVMLDQGMAEAQVMEVLGPPDRTETKMCGERTGEPWPCVVWIYNRNSRQMWLILLFEKGPPMKLNSWSWP